MTPILAAALVAILFFGGSYFLFARVLGPKSAHTKSALRQLSKDAIGGSAIPEESIIRVDFSGSVALRTIAGLPLVGEKIGEKILQAGLEKKASVLLIVSIVLIIAAPLAALHASDNDPKMALLALGVTLYFIWNYLSRAVRKRNNLFINDFPDVLDMIVRSVRSGFPVNAAINMVAENMEPPISNEFRQVADEIALGRTLDDALTRLGQRINEADVQFFVVVLKVQQETGGNLAEVISNLSNVIRKRKQLRLKIRAMTSEGRATGWILGALPVVVFIALEFVAPQHLRPLFDTATGRMWLGIAIALVVATQVIVRKMTDVEI